MSNNDASKNKRPRVGGGKTSATVQPLNLVTPLATDSGSSISTIGNSVFPVEATTPTVIEPPPGSPYTHGQNNNEEDDDDVLNFALYTKESFQEQLDQEEADRIKAQEKKDRPAEGRLVDGELKFDDDDDDPKNKERDPNLVEGSYLPEYMTHDFPSEYVGKPIEEIDPNIRDKV